MVKKSKQNSIIVVIAFRIYLTVEIMGRMCLKRSGDISSIITSPSIGVDRNAFLSVREERRGNMTKERREGSYETQYIYIYIFQRN